MDDDWGYPYDSGNLHIDGPYEEEENGWIAAPSLTGRPEQRAASPGFRMLSAQSIYRQWVSCKNLKESLV